MMRKSADVSAMPGSMYPTSVATKPNAVRAAIATSNALSTTGVSLNAVSDSSSAMMTVNAPNNKPNMVRKYVHAPRLVNRTTLAHTNSSGGRVIHAARDNAPFAALAPGRRLQSRLKMTDATMDSWRFISMANRNGIGVFVKASTV